jgi:hypothetical protein
VSFLNLIKNIFSGKNDGWINVVQSPQEPFPLHNSCKLKTLEEIVIALPKALIDQNETIGSVIFCDDDAEISMPFDADCIYICLQAGMVLSSAKSTQAMIIAEDVRPRRLSVLRS